MVRNGPDLHPCPCGSSHAAPAPTLCAHSVFATADHEARSCSCLFGLGSSSPGAGSTGSRVSAALGRLAGVCLFQHMSRKNQASERCQHLAFNWPPSPATLTAPAAHASFGATWAALAQLLLSQALCWNCPRPSQMPEIILNCSSLM